MATIKMVKEAAFRNVANIKFHLSIKPMTVHELADKVGLTHRALSRYLNLLREENEIRIGGFKPTIRANGANLPVPLYEIGSAPNVKYKPLNRHQRNRLEQKRLKEDMDRRDRINAKARAKNLKPVLQDEVAFLFGRATN